MKKRKVQRPNPFGHPHYPSFDFYVSNGTVQVYPIRGNAALYGIKFEEFQKWLKQVKRYSEYELGRFQ